MTWEELIERCPLKITTKEEEMFVCELKDTGAEVAFWKDLFAEFSGNSFISAREFNSYEQMLSIMEALK